MQVEKAWEGPLETAVRCGNDTVGFVDKLVCNDVLMTL